MNAQDALVERLIGRFTDAVVDDKRALPTFNYRAVHVVVTAPLPYEIQVRTAYQHTWAQLSERLADRYGFELKYGGGPQNVVAALAEYSEFCAAADIFRASDTGTVDTTMIGTLRSHVERLSAILEVLKIQ